MLGNDAQSRHPPLARGWIDATHRSMEIGDFATSTGNSIEAAHLSYVVHGNDNENYRPTVLALCAIGSSHHRLDFLIGSDKGLDPDRFRIIVVDAIGNGLSSSPSNSVSQPGRAFPRFTIEDMVRSQRELLKRLEIHRLHAVVGASMGGMQALAWAVLYPEIVERVVALTPMAKSTAWSQIVNWSARAHLEAGLLRVACGAPVSDAWADWVPLMQALSMRTPSQIDRELGDSPDVPDWIGRQISRWCEQNFDPLDWISQSHAYDAFDLGSLNEFSGDTDAALASIRAATFVAAPPLDLYNPADAARRVARRIAGSVWFDIDSDYGHVAASSADPRAAAALGSAVSAFLSA